MDQDYTTQQLLMRSNSSAHHHQDQDQDQNQDQNNTNNSSSTTGAAGNGGGRSCSSSSFCLLGAGSSSSSLAPPHNSTPSPDQHHHNYGGSHNHHNLPTAAAMNTSCSTTFHLLQHDQSAPSVARTTAAEDQHYSHHFLSPPPPSHESAEATRTQVKLESSPNTIHHQQQHQLHYSSLIRGHEQTLAHHQQQQLHLQLQHHLHPQQQRFLQGTNTIPGGGINIGISSSSNDHLQVDAIRAKIITHPQYSSLLEAYMDCQKVGAPAEVVAKLTEARHEFFNRQKSSLMASSSSSSSSSQADPELDQFMEAYYDMLVKYREELTRPLQEAMDFMRRIEAQLNTLNNGVPVRIPTADEKCEGVGSSEDDQENSGGETELLPEIDPRAEDRELKNHLLRKYSGYLSSLKQELSKKKKKGKLPKEARQKLLSWWELHYKWPYPSETEKVALAESTGLDQKQINNWFINQRKRHWKPSEDMQFVVMEGLHPQSAALYMDGHFIGDGHYRLGP